MGNSSTCGIAVLNTSDSPINVKLTMLQIAPHYWEGNVQKGHIFYRWPGAVSYTVMVSNDVGSDTMRNCYAGGNGTWLIAEVMRLVVKS
jgi:hypothetical protein